MGDKSKKESVKKPSDGLSGKEKTRKAVGWILFVLLVISIPFIIYLSNLRLIGLNQALHRQQFSKHGVYADFPDDDPKALNAELVDYLINEKTDKQIGNGIYNQKEKEHLVDVKNLVQKSFFLLNMLLISAAILLVALIFADKMEFPRKLWLSCMWGGALTLFDALIFAIVIGTNFDAFFTWFHRLFFRGETWQLSSTDALIKLYPEGLFHELLLIIVLATLIIAVALIFFGVIIKKRIKEINEKKPEEKAVEKPAEKEKPVKKGKTAEKKKTERAKEKK